MGTCSEKGKRAGEVAQGGRVLTSWDRPGPFITHNPLPMPLGRNTASCEHENVVFGVKEYGFWNQMDVSSSGRTLVSYVTMGQLNCLAFTFIA